MTATEELRRLLDERGVEWSDSSDENVRHTTWNNQSCWFTEYSDGWTGWGMSKGGTPAEAIESTLRRGACRMITDGDGWWECDTCGATIDWDSCDENDPPSCCYCPNCGRKVVDE